jgi:hypothetical protein
MGCPLKQANKHGASDWPSLGPCRDSQDLKFDNLMVGKDQETGAYSLRLGDFGLMRVRSSNVPGAASAASAMDEPHAHVLRAQSDGVVSCRRGFTPPASTAHLQQGASSCVRVSVRQGAGAPCCALPHLAPGLGSPLPHLHRDWAHPCHICTGTGLTPATSAPALGGGEFASSGNGSGWGNGSTLRYSGVLWSTLRSSGVLWSPLARPMQLPPELLELVVSYRSKLGYTLRRKESVKTMDPAAADVWAAGHILLWLVGIRALQVMCLAYPLSAP